MNIREVFPAGYLSAADLEEQNVVAIIENVRIERIVNDPIPVLYFRDWKKGMQLDRYNADLLANAYGEETDCWIGQYLEIFSRPVNIQGVLQACIRIHVPEISGVIR